MKFKYHILLAAASLCLGICSTAQAGPIKFDIAGTILTGYDGAQLFTQNSNFMDGLHYQARITLDPAYSDGAFPIGSGMARYYQSISAIANSNNLIQAEFTINRKSFTYARNFSQNKYYGSENIDVIDNDGGEDRFYLYLENGSQGRSPYSLFELAFLSLDDLFQGTEIPFNYDWPVSNFYSSSLQAPALNRAVFSQDINGVIQSTGFSYRIEHISTVPTSNTLSLCMLGLIALAFVRRRSNILT